MKTLTRKIKINVSREEAWNVLFNQFGQVSKFNPLISNSAHLSGVEGEVGVVRSCDLNAGGTIKEKIVSAMPLENFDLEIIEGSMPMIRKMYASYSFKSITDSQTEVTFTVRFVASPSFMGGLMKMMMGKKFLKMLTSLKQYLESGKEVNTN